MKPKVKPRILGLILGRNVVGPESPSLDSPPPHTCRLGGGGGGFQPHHSARPCYGPAVWLLISDTKVTFDTFSVRFDVVFTCLFQFAMCFVFTNCPVLCFVAVRSTHCFVVLPFWLLVGVPVLAGEFLFFFNGALWFWERVDLRVLLCYFLWDESISTLFINYLRLRVLA